MATKPSVKYTKSIKRALANDVSYIVTVKDTNGDVYAFVPSTSNMGTTPLPIYSMDGVVDFSKYLLDNDALKTVLKAFHALRDTYWQIAVEDYEHPEDAVYMVKKSLEVLCVTRSYGTMSKSEIAAFK